MLDLVIRPVAPEMHDDLMHYFDLVAYADNPAWSNCYCCERIAADFDARTKQENRATRSRLVQEGAAYGLVAYRLSRVVGWCHAAPKRALLNLPAPGDGDVGVIVCFVIAPDSRRQGIASALLERACVYLKDLGMRVAEAYPWRDEPQDAERWPHIQYVGPMSMYRKYGFRPSGVAGDHAIVRKSL